MDLTKTWQETDGAPQHDTICEILDRKVCTCGLLEHLAVGSALEGELYDQWVRHNATLQIITRTRSFLYELQRMKRE